MHNYCIPSYSNLGSLFLTCFWSDNCYVDLRVDRPFVLLQLDKKVAERTLREHKGDAVAAIRHLLHVGNL